MNGNQNEKVSVANRTLPLTLQVRAIEDLLMDIRRILFHEEELKGLFGDREVRERLEDLVSRSRESLSLLSLLQKSRLRLSLLPRQGPRLLQERRLPQASRLSRALPLPQCT